MWAHCIFFSGFVVVTIMARSIASMVLKKEIAESVDLTVDINYARYKGEC